MKRIILRKFLFTLAAVASLIAAKHAAIADDHRAVSPGEQIVNESIFPPRTVPLDPSKASAYSPVYFSGATEKTELTLASGAPAATVVNPAQASFTLACNQLPPPGLALEIRSGSNIRFAKTRK
jgi:hypothetical protein